jgi:transcriptional regulator with XRE-family HTH domain
MSYDKMIFASNLNYYLKACGENQNDLCNLFGISSSTVSGWCTGKISPRMDKVQVLADHFGCKISDLIEKRGASSADDEILQAIHDTPGMRIMFDVNRHHTNEDILQAVEIIKAFYKTKNGGDAQ